MGTGLRVSGNPFSQPLAKKSGSGNDAGRNRSERRAWHDLCFHTSSLEAFRPSRRRVSAASPRPVQERFPMSLLSTPTMAPRLSLIYLTVGTLIDVWTTVWYF